MSYRLSPRMLAPLLALLLLPAGAALGAVALKDVPVTVLKPMGVPVVPVIYNPVHADDASPIQTTDRIEIGLALKSLPLLTQKITGSAVMAVVYNADSPGSKADAVSIKKIMDDGYPVPGGVKLTAQLVSTADLAALSGAKIAFVAGGLGDKDFQALSLAVRGSGILTVSADQACVQSGGCIIAVAARPVVTITYNRAAAENAGVSFAPAFIMLAKQV